MYTVHNNEIVVVDDEDCTVYTCVRGFDVSKYVHKKLYYAKK